MATVGEGTEDTYLTTKSRESELKGAQHNLVEKGNLALNKKEKKNEGQNNHLLHIKCIATT